MARKVQSVVFLGETNFLKNDLVYIYMPKTVVFIPLKQTGTRGVLNVYEF